MCSYNIKVTLLYTSYKVRLLPRRKYIDENYILLNFAKIHINIQYVIHFILWQYK